MVSELTKYEEGRRDRNRFLFSQGFASLSRNITATDAMRLFLPPVKNDMVQMSRPLPKPFQDWVDGWNDCKAEEGIEDDE